MDMADKGMFGLSGKVALVTAGGHGLGRVFCEVIAEYGADVVCADIDIGLAQETARLIKRFGNQAVAIQVDVSKPDQVETMVNRVIAEFSTIDILFNNAGIPNRPVRIHELSIEDWKHVVSVNLTGMFLCMRAVIPIMLEKKRGSIINTASVAGLMAGSEERSLANAAPYGATKAAIIGLTRHAAVAYAKGGIRINAIAPGAHSTYPLAVPREEMDKIQDQIAKFVPMGRVGNPSEIKGLALYLASDASSYVTGQTFVHDGGFIA